MDTDDQLDITSKKQTGLWAYTAETYELAFLCYIEMDRSVSRAMLRFDEVANGMRNPDRVTWFEWRKRDEWNAKADYAVAADFPAIRRRQLARLVMLNERALDFDAAMLAGEHDHARPSILHAKVQTSAMIKQLSGLGAASGQGAPAIPSLPPHADDPDDIDAARRRHLDRLKRDRQGKRG